MPALRDWLLHVVPAGEEHTTTGYVCWCCPLLYDSDEPGDEHPLSAAEADAVLARDGNVLVMHRSEVPGENVETGPVPWQLWSR
jgi:hypothetical protein